VENFPSNSREPRPVPEEKTDEKRVQKVIEGTVVRRKKTIGQRFSELFFSHGQEVVGYIVNSVLIPAAKDMLVDAVSQGIERMAFGEERSTRRSSSRHTGVFGGNSQVNYNRYSTGPSRRTEGTYGTGVSRRPRGHNFDDVILPSRAEAEDVLEQMSNILDKWEQVTVRDLYELVGENFHHTDEKHGWTNLRDAGVRRLGSGGYLLDLPKTEPLD
jgi:hypothetical protein